MTCPLVRELATDGIAVAVTCRVLKIARQPFYQWLARPVTEAELIEVIGPTHCSTPGPPVHDDLVGRNFTAEVPNQLWLGDIERHEALLNRVEVGDLHRCVVAAAR